MIFTVLINIVIEPDFKECFRIDEFYFRDWGKNPSQLDTMELTDIADMCTCDSGLGGGDT